MPHVFVSGTETFSARSLIHLWDANLDGSTFHSRDDSSCVSWWTVGVDLRKAGGRVVYMMIANGGTM